MSIKSFDSFNEEKSENFIKDSIKKPGSLRKSLKKKEGERIPMREIDSELQALKGRDKDKKKPGTQLGKKDAKKYKRLNLAKTLKSLKESLQGHDSYELMGGLNDIKKLLDDILDLDESDFEMKLDENTSLASRIGEATTAIEDIHEIFFGDGVAFGGLNASFE